VEVKFDIGPEVSINLDKSDLEEIKKNINKMEKFILSLKEEFLKIPKKNRDYFNVEVSVWNRLIDDKPCTVKVFMMTSLIGGISLGINPNSYTYMEKFLIGNLVF